MKTIVYLHGALSTPTTFSYITEMLPEHEAIMIEYDSVIKLTDALESIAECLIQEFGDNPDREFDIIAHSLGGLMAVNIASDERFNVGKIITIASPFGGSEAAWLMRFIYPFTTIFREISPFSNFVMSTRDNFDSYQMARIIKEKRFLPIITNIGHGILLRGDNDRIVTLASQKAIPDVDSILVELNHFEVLQSADVVNEIKVFLDM